MGNYKLYANLIRKPDPSDFNARPCVVEKWIPLSHWSFEQIKQDPLHDLEAVKAYRDLMFCDNEANHCIMLLDGAGGDGVARRGRGDRGERRENAREPRHVHQEGMCGDHAQIRLPALHGGVCGAGTPAAALQRLALHVAARGQP